MLVTESHDKPVAIAVATGLSYFCYIDFLIIRAPISIARTVLLKQSGLGVEEVFLNDLNFWLGMIFDASRDGWPSGLRLQS